MQEVNNLDSSVDVQELELAMNVALYGLLWSLRRAYTDSATCSRLVRDQNKTEIAEGLQRSRNGFLEVANQSPIEISRELYFEHAQKTGCDWIRSRRGCIGRQMIAD